MNKEYRNLVCWLESIKNIPLEEMDSFFTTRIDGYEEHMSRWNRHYKKLARLIPAQTKNLLDLGCGTGLELDYIYKLFPNISITGIDLSRAMLEKLKEKYHREDLKLICSNYLKYEFLHDKYEAVVSFETLHHLKKEDKTLLFKKVHDSLKANGIYIECDYIAQNDEIENLLFTELKNRRITDGLSEETTVHFDTPLTLNHEVEALREAGFKNIKTKYLIGDKNTAIIIANK